MPVWGMFPTRRIVVGGSAGQMKTTRRSARSWRARYHAISKLGRERGAATATGIVTVPPQTFVSVPSCHEK